MPAIVLVPPYIIRVLDLTEADLRPFRVGRDVGSAIVELLVSVPPCSSYEKAWSGD